MKKVICISGKSQHGKDTSAGFIKSELEAYGERVLIIHFADLLKYICRTYFGWNGEKDENGRTLLQYVGTDVVRRQNPNYWVEFIVDFLKLFQNEWDYVLIPDCRFPNEIYCFKENNIPAIHIRVQRPGFTSALTEEQKQHISETALDDAPYDILLINSSLEQLKQEICDYVRKAEENEKQ